MHELLADLEQEVIRNGADEGILAAIERERRSVYELTDDSADDYGDEPAT